MGGEIAKRLSATMGYGFVDKHSMAWVMRLAVRKDICGKNPLRAEPSALEEYMIGSLKSRETVYRLQTGGEIPPLFEDEWDFIEDPEVTILDEFRFYNLVRELVLDLCNHGDVVILGRGGQAILRERDDAFHVRVIAPIEHRVQNLMRSHMVEEEVARRSILESDGRKAQLMQTHFELSWDDPLLYDLIINTRSISVRGAVRLATQAIINTMKRRK
jgi:hypothetical protein